MALEQINDKTSLTLNNQLELLCFRLRPNGTLFAINVFKVRETVKYEPLTQIPDASEEIDGLLTLRTQIIPVVNLVSWLYGNLIPENIKHDIAMIDNKDKQFIICDFNSVTLGVNIYKAEYILRKNWEDIMVPITQEFGTKVNNYTKNDDDEIVYILDIEQMLSDLFPEIAHEIENNLDTLYIQEIDISKTILIAEDSIVALKALENVLNKIGVKYKAFPNGQELLDHIKKLSDYSHIGLIITDLEMPIASGFTVIKELKSKSKTAQIPIVVNSSMSGDSNMELAESLGADGFMAKTSPKEIATFVYKFLGV